jgi:hypothetical protein
MCTWHICSRRCTPDFHSHQWHPSTFPSMTVRLVSQHRRNQCQVSVAWRRQLASSWCLLHITHQPHVFLQRSKAMEIPGPHPTTRYVNGYDTMTRQFWTTLLTVLISNPVISISLNPKRSTWLASDLQQIPTWRGCHILAANSWHSLLLCWVTSLGTRMGQKLKYQWYYVGVWCVPSATHVLHHGWQNKVLGISVWYTVLWNMLLCIPVTVTVYLFVVIPF